MKQSVVFGILLLHNSKVFGSDVIASCPHEYTQPLDSNWPSCYKIYSSLMLRKDAINQCKSDNGSLASVPNAFVNSYLYSLATNSNFHILHLAFSALSMLVNLAQMTMAPVSPTIISQLVNQIGTTVSVSICPQKYQMHKNGSHIK